MEGEFTQSMLSIVKEVSEIKKTCIDRDKKLDRTAEEIIKLKQLNEEHAQILEELKEENDIVEKTLPQRVRQENGFRKIGV